MDLETVNVYIDHSKIALKNEFTMEDIVSQLQPNLKSILCVLNGSELLIFKTHQMIPPNLKYGGTSTNQTTGQSQYYFYSNDEEEDCYCFFLRAVYEWLISGRQVPYQGQGVRPPPVVKAEYVYTGDSGVEESDLIGTELTVDTDINDSGAHKDVYTYQVRRNRN